MIDCLAIIKPGNTYCKECQRCPVCKYSEIFTKYLESANAVVPEELKDIAQNNVRCKFFLQQVTMR